MEEKRGKGRPRNEENYINEDNLKRPERNNTKQALKRAEKAYKTAQKVYKAYEEAKPNPLNLPFKDLSDEAKTMWEYLFSLRGVEIEDVGKIKPAFDSMKELITAYQCFCVFIVQHRFIDELEIPITPTYSDFARWLGVTPRTVEAYVAKNASEEEKKALMALRSDILFKGAAAKVYEKTITIFAMKNWCDWSDKQEVKQEVTEQGISQEEIEDRLKNLGYSRDRLELVK